MLAPLSKVLIHAEDENRFSRQALNEEHLAPEWQSTLETNGLASFDQFWRAKGVNIDSPNIGRGGWSQVILLDLKGSPERALYVKRQWNYQTRNWHKLRRSELMAHREFRNFEHCRKHGVPTPLVVYFATERVAGRPAAVFATEALLDHEPLSAHLKALPPDRPGMRQRVMVTVARQLARMHRSGLKHGCLYPKHVLVPTDPEKVDELRFIDLEKAKPFLFRRSALHRDFRTLFRRLTACTKGDRAAFLDAYYSEW